jgi:hypothetical protein
MLISDYLSSNNYNNLYSFFDLIHFKDLGTVPNMKLQFTSKSTRFSVKIENF